MTGGVLGPEEPDRVRGRGVAQQAAVRQAAEAELLLTEYRRHRPDPVLGNAVADGLAAAQRRDRGAAAVEAQHGVGWQEGGPHGPTSPEPRITTSQAIVRCTGPTASPSRRL